MIDFDDIKKNGFFRSLFFTWKKSLFTPEDFFQEISTNKNIMHPYFYAIIFGYMNLVFSFFWEILFFRIGFYSNYSFLPQIPLLFEQKNTLAFFIILGIAILLLIAGILYTVFLMILTVIIHGFNLLLGGKNEFRYTFRIICYSAGVNLFSILPIFGYNVVTSWFAVLAVIGIKKTNGLSTARSIMVILLPYIFLSLIAIIFIVKIIAMR